MSGRYIIRLHKKEIQPNSSAKIRKIIIDKQSHLKTSLIGKQCQNQYLKQCIKKKQVKNLLSHMRSIRPKQSKVVQNANKITEVEFQGENQSRNKSFSLPIKQVLLKKRFSLNMNASPLFDKQTLCLQKDNQSTFQSEGFLPILRKQHTQRNYKNRNKIAPVKILKNPFPCKLYVVKNKNQEKGIYDNNILDPTFSRISQILKAQDQDKFIGAQSFQILNF